MATDSKTTERSEAPERVSGFSPTCSGGKGFVERGLGVGSEVVHDQDHFSHIQKNLFRKVFERMSEVFVKTD